MQPGHEPKDPRHWQDTNTSAQLPETQAQNCIMFCNQLPEKKHFKCWHKLLNIVSDLCRTNVWDPTFKHMLTLMPKLGQGNNIKKKFEPNLPAFKAKMQHNT